jgi:ribosome maturation factor RimP
MSGFPRHFCFYPRSVFVVSTDPLSVESLQSAVTALGFELVDVELVGPAARQEVRLRIDRPGGAAPGGGVTTDDCRRVSRALEERLDTSGVVGSRYVLEVSSPGIERPVRFAEHWRRYVGRDVRIKAKGLSGTVTARIVAVPDEEQVTVAVGPEHHTLPFAAIKRATLVVDWSTLGGTGKQENR